MLSVQGLTKRFGGVVALDDLSFDLGPGEIVGLIGPNGSGKTTCVNTVSGLYDPDAGHVLLDGRSLDGAPPHRIVRLGIGRTFQNLRLLHDMSVIDNVRVAQSARISSISGWCSAHSGKLHEDAMRLLEMVNLDSRALTVAGKLSYGQQKRLEMARALATRPRFLLLDEPAGGMNADDIDELAVMMQAMKTDGVGLLLIEHNMGFVMGVCDRVVVLNFGRKLATGTPEEIRAHPDVIEAYLGRPT
jgi:branched-chain amino acid transport system ATP-binding protein